MSGASLRPQLLNLLKEWKSEKRAGFLVLGPEGIWEAQKKPPAQGTPYIEVLADGEIRHHRNNGTGAFRVLSL
ncbi:MAG: hypothetical protein U1F33_08385 [Alphaproteobacteria bacterium]